MLYSVRSERQWVEQINYNLLYRWFVGSTIEDRVWDHSTFSINRDRLLENNVITELFEKVVNLAKKHNLLSDEHFSVDGTLIQAWASQKSYRRKDDDSGPPSGVARNDKRKGGSAIDGRTSRHRRYEISQRTRKRVEEPFGWGKSIGLIRQMQVRGLSKVNGVFMMTMIGWNLTRMRSLQG